jgi:glycosyltransferase involved in cell wall biosynthesis
VTVAARLDRRRFEPAVCVSRGPNSSPLSEILEEAGVPIVTLNRTSRYALWNWAPLVGTLRRRRIDLLHAHMFGSNAWGTILGRAAGVPVVIAHEHGSPLEPSRLRAAIDRQLVARAADVLVAVSESDRRRLIDAEGVPRSKVRLVPNGIAPLPAARADLREELGIPEGVPVIGTLTVLRPEKALELLVEAAALLKTSFPDLRVLIAGTGPEEERLRRLIAERGLERTILLLGFRPHVADVLAALDVVIHASDREGSPLALLESMAAGKAIVATHVGGIPELLKNEEHALLVPPRDAPALAAAAARVLLDETLREQLGRNAQERQCRKFDIQTTVTEFEDLYEQLVASSRNTPSPSRR